MFARDGRASAACGSSNVSGQVQGDAPEGYFKCRSCERIVAKVERGRKEANE